MATETNKGYFLPIDSNKSIENFQPRYAHNAAKGAFSEEARDALALAVSKKQRTVLMDGNPMTVLYYKDYVHVVASNSAKLPCGNFDKKILAGRLEES